jgi:zinc protease
MALAATLNVPFVLETLANGLDVIVHSDRDCPIVAVNVWYHVGSKNERPGRTGFAHLFEHLMFEGSAHYDRGYFLPLQEAGAALNGSTNTDRTNYWEVVPTNALELALWMESDRMGFLLPALTEAKYETQRQVVLNERRQHYENRPYGRAMMALVAALFPPDHPYHWPTIGAVDDLRSASFDEVREFFRTYYHPGNASLVLAGDLDEREGLELARRYFEDIPPGPPSPPVAAPDEESRKGERRLLLEDRVELPRLYLAWPTPRLFARGDAELDLVAGVLASGKCSRLHRRLVHELKIATDVVAAQNARELAGFFHIAATAAPGVPLGRLEGEVSAALAELAARGPEPIEFDRSLAQLRAQFVYRLQTVGGFGGKSDQLNAYNVFVGDPGYFGRDLGRYEAAGADDLRWAAAEFLDPTRRVTLSVVPHGAAHLAVPDSTPIQMI